MLRLACKLCDNLPSRAFGYTVCPSQFDIPYLLSATIVPHSRLVVNGFISTPAIQRPSILGRRAFFS